MTGGLPRRLEAKTSMPPCELYVVRHAIAAERGDRVARRRQASADRKRHRPFQGWPAGPDLARRSARRDLHQPARARQADRRPARGRYPGKAAGQAARRSGAGTRPDEVMTQLARAARRRRIALVGHEPGLGELAAHLLGAKRPLAFRKGGVCRIDLQGLTGKRPGRWHGSSRRKCCGRWVSED